MYHLSSCLLSGLVAAAAMTPFVSNDKLVTGFESRIEATSVVPKSPSMASTVNRELKGDRLTIRAATSEESVKTSAGPARTTNPSDGGARKRDRAKRNMPDGCESSFSVTSERSLAGIAGRCVTERQDERQAPRQVARVS
jgi:hypothetical protein